MGSLTRTCPKALLNVGGRPLLDRTLDLARAAGIRRIIVNAHHLASRIAAHLADSDCVVLHETPEILDTGGGLKAAAPYLGQGPVFTANPDAVWSGPNPFDVLKAAAKPEKQATLLLVPLDRAIGRDHGDFEMAGGRPRRRGPFVYTGVQIIRPEAVVVEGDTVFSLNRVWDRLIPEETLGAALYPGRWCDVGTPEWIARAEAMLGEGAE